jgi:hypothetical protein
MRRHHGRKHNNHPSSQDKGGRPHSAAHTISVRNAPITHNHHPTGQWPHY